MNTPTNVNPLPNGTPNSNNNSKRLLTIAAIAITALLGTNIFLLVNKYKTGETLSQTVRELDTKSEALAELETRYSDATAQLEQMKGTNAELNSKIDEQLKQLEEQKNKISSLISVNGDLKRARAEIQGLVKQKDEYVMQISTLKEENAKLAASNAQLTTEKEVISKDLTATKGKLDEESTAKAALISEKTKLESTNQQLGKKVDIASAVKVSAVEIKSLKVKSNGKEKSKMKAKNIDKLNICFKTEANDVVEAGEEKFYIRVIDPTGAPLAIESLGSGVEKDKKKESEFRYTTTTSCNYTNSVTDVCAAWQPGQDFIKGKYLVEIYNKGYLVGNGEFKLK
jgi:DNA repair exonuclease SbcCD ATPase subunit